MGTFEKVADSTEGKYAVVYQNAANDVWGVEATVYDTEAEAAQRAATIVENGSAKRARVCPPTGDLFQDLEA